MRFKSIRPKFWPFTLRSPEETVLRDADELIQIWGNAAYSVATTMSWREDTGLIHTALPGHWSRVKREIGFRLGCRDEEPEANFGAEQGQAPNLM